MFFQKTIKSLHNQTSSLSNEILIALKTSGIAANLADLKIDKSGIYFPLPNQTTAKVMLYQAKIQESHYRTKGDPLVHLCGCQESLQNHDNPDFLAIIHPNMQFFVSIYSHKIQTRFFNQKPLSICPKCLHNLGVSSDKNLEAFLDSSYNPKS